MNTDHDHVRLLLGAFVLGGLDAADRQRVEQHLASCEACREEISHTAAIPALLRRLPDGRGPQEQENWAQAGDLSPQLLPALLAGVRREQRTQRRRDAARWLVAAAVLVAVTAGGVGVVLSQNSASSPVVAFTAAGSAQAVGSAALTAKPWGTALTVQLADLPTGGPFTLEVTRADGTRERAAAWGPTPNGAAEVSGATSVEMEEIAGLTVVGPEGPVLRADVTQ